MNKLIISISALFALAIGNVAGATTVCDSFISAPPSTFSATPSTLVYMNPNATCFVNGTTVFGNHYLVNSDANPSTQYNAVTRIMSNCGTSLDHGIISGSSNTPVSCVAPFTGAFVGYLNTVLVP